MRQAFLGTKAAFQKYRSGRAFLQSSRLGISKGELGVNSKIHWHRHMPGKLAQHLPKLGLTPGRLTKVKKAHNSSRGELRNDSVCWKSRQIGQLKCQPERNGERREARKQRMRRRQWAYPHSAQSTRPWPRCEGRASQMRQLQPQQASARMPAQDQQEGLLL